MIMSHMNMRATTSEVNMRKNNAQNSYCEDGGVKEPCNDSFGDYE